MGLDRHGSRTLFTNQTAGICLFDKEETSMIAERGLGCVRQLMGHVCYV
jgi:hypothetical protein